MSRTDRLVQLPAASLKPNHFGSDINPPISDTDFEALKASISKSGIRIPLICWRSGNGNVVVSGNNRLKIARQLKIKTVPVICRHFDSVEDAKMFALIDNLARRHMSTAQKAEKALELQKLLAVGKGRRTDLDTGSNKVNSWTQAAKLSGVSLSTVNAYKTVMEHGDRKLIEKVRAGTVKLSAAHRLVREIQHAAPTSRVPILSDEPVTSLVVGSSDELIANVARLYLRPKMKIADVTYGEGLFWRRMDMSKYDFHPSDIATTEIKMDFRRLKHQDNSFDVVVLDPPFLPNAGDGYYLAGIRYKNRESSHRTYGEVLELYRKGMSECFRILKPRGQLWVKCGDYFWNDKQVMTHIIVHDYAVNELKMRVLDMFVQGKKQNPLMVHPLQRTARKTHSYLWIFRK